MQTETERHADFQCRECGRRFTSPAWCGDCDRAPCLVTTGPAMGPLATADSVNNGKVYIVQEGGPPSDSVALASSEANAARIVACVNACAPFGPVMCALAGIRAALDKRDPGEIHAALIAAAADANKALRALRALGG